VEQDQKTDENFAQSEVEVQQIPFNPNQEPHVQIISKSFAGNESPKSKITAQKFVNSMKN
jgi:hypothetical protein